jgi:hypothetical protein
MEITIYATRRNIPEDAILYISFVRQHLGFYALCRMLDHYEEWRLLGC